MSDEIKVYPGLMCESQSMSHSIGKIAEALSKAQGAMEAATKGSENPFFKSKYADLYSVWTACRKPLSDNGLAVVQTLGNTSDKEVTINTLLVHSSGEWFKSSLSLKPTKPDAQGMGSAISYGRRYALAAIVGVVQEDDDGNAASKPQQAQLKDEPIGQGHKAVIEGLLEKLTPPQKKNFFSKYPIVADIKKSEVDSIIAKLNASITANEAVVKKELPNA